MTTAKEDAYARRYYKTHSAYRRKKINERKEYAKSHKKEEAAQSREYYHSNSEYRQRRIKQVQRYNKSHKAKKRK